MSKKYIYLMGGLGNVLFQLNKAFELSKKGHEVRISVLLLQKRRLLARLLGWSDHGTLKVLEDLGIMNDFNKFKGSMISLALLLVSKKIDKCIFSHQYLKHNKQENQECTVLIGYFSSRAVIDKGFSDNVRSYFNLAERKMNYRLNNAHIKELECSIVLHFRGGDYFDNNNIKREGAKLIGFISAIKKK